MTKEERKEVFLNKFKHLEKDIELLTEYEDCKTKIKCKCKKCNNEWLSIPSVILRQNSGCPKCAGKNKTTEDFKKEIHNMYGEEYQVLGEYIGSKTKILIKHTLCNSEFYMQPSNFLSGQQCPNCKQKRIGDKIRKTQEKFEQEVYNLVGNEYTVLGKYVNCKTKILFRHNICGNIFYMTPSHFLRGNRCPRDECLKLRISEKLRKNPDEFKKEFENLVNGEYELLSDYTKSCETVKIKHVTCGNIFNMRPNNFLSGQRCPVCSVSKGEDKIRKFLMNTGVVFIHQKMFDDLKGVNYGNLSYDFYIPDKNLLIEYQGEYHDGTAKNQTKEEFEKQQEHDKRKKEYAKKHGIELLEIWYWDFNKIEEILKQNLNI